MKVGIIGAMEVEVASLKASLQDSKSETVAGMEFCEGTLGGITAVVVKCGVGKVNAACCVQVLADRFGVDAIVNTGVAGSLDNRIDIGDIVVSTDAVYHDVDATVFGYAPGEVPQMGVKTFPADEGLREKAFDAVRKAAPDVSVFEGRVVSGDQFISSRERKDWIRKTFGGLCCEMEGCAIAQASFVNRIPFVIIRAISDKADESVKVSYAEFEGKAAEHCAGIVARFLTSF
ncbi:MAG: 5'-methylthioadenosine/adenosylhomocysteine nucleosidase [Sutterellaceae bacterium]|nr:5'-methylthioadenosine/adenosylhomocysteine nucleosidase [Sutterellaceae bacterium]MDY2869042.1 5'-methylthioadenosine/adenosylhomocysteine nucleosidase [Mesosutterella sp.]